MWLDTKSGRHFKSKLIECPNQQWTLGKYYFGVRKKIILIIIIIIIIVEE